MLAKQVLKSCTLRGHYLLKQDRHFTRSTPSQFSMFEGMLATLREKATETLTSNLSKQEKDELIYRLDPSLLAAEKSSKTENTVIEKSIAEAVAEAQAHEAQRQEEKWLKEEKAIRESVEKAALARVQHELHVQKHRIEFEKWEAARRGADSSDAADATDSAKEGTELANPILGPAIVDFGHKRVHIVSARQLISVPIWKKQRIYRHSRAEAMATDKMKTLHLGLPGIIALHEDSNGKLTIIDGQHRVGMMSILLEKNVSHEEFDLDKVLVEVYVEQDSHGSTHAQDLFLEVNKAEPVKLVDMPGVAQVGVRKVISDGAQRIADTYPDMFKPSQRCRSPHLNIDNLRDALFASSVLKKHGIKSGAALEKWMLEQNTKLAERLTTSDERDSFPKKALEKAEKFNFYLGLTSEWMYN